MNVAFVHSGNDSMASYRYRTQIPAEQLTQRGEFNVTINEGEADVVVFSKPVQTDVGLAEQCKKDGTKIIVDICDDHFDHPVYGAVYRDIIKLSDTVVCPTDYFRKVIFQKTGKNAAIIPDPYEMERMKPHANGDNVLWYGHQVNIPEITPYVGKIDNLSVCTGHNNTLVGYIPWSPESQKAELAYNDIVILPNKNESKSSNRLINAVMAGCFVCANKTMARHEFREFMWIGDIYTGLKWSRAFQSDLNSLISECQDYIERHYSPKLIGDLWGEVV